MDINNVLIIGRLTRDGELAYTPNGTARLNIALAVNEGYGEKKSVSFFDATVWGKQAESIKAYCLKGKQLAVSGRLKQDRWEKNGQTFSKVYIIAENVQLLGGNTAANPQPAMYSTPEAGEFPEEIPF